MQADILFYQDVGMMYNEIVDHEATKATADIALEQPKLD
jgi:hypothetical protein